MKIRPVGLGVLCLVGCGFLAIGCGDDDGGDDRSGAGGTASGGSGGGSGGVGASGGSGATGGGATGGSGGSNVTTGKCSSLGTTGGLDPLIEDFEDGDSAIYEEDGRTGYWFVDNDKSAGGVQTPAAASVAPVDDDVHGGDYAFHSTATGFTGDYGASFGVSFNNQGDSSCGYDASAFDGISFWAKGTDGTSVQFKLPMLEVLPSTAGGSCASDCYNTHQVTVSFDGTWQYFEFSWDEFKQDPTWGTQVAFDAASITQMQWSTPKNPGSYDVRLDDIQFVGGNPGQGGASNQ